ncbi:hypothetical protein C8R46DRAFT_1204014 [Mycena filopes]|nr:hypothetical protein C8R46DRAFT_1204014 [Mycena filopes]
MFSMALVRRVLEVVRATAAARDATDRNAVSAPTQTHPATRRTRTRSASASSNTNTIKASATCHGHPLLVTVTAAPHILDVLAAATSPPPFFQPVFRITIEENVVAAEVAETGAASAQNIVVPRPPRASERVDAGGVVGGCTQARPWENDVVDANATLQKPVTNPTTCTTLNVMTWDTIDLVEALFHDPSTIVWMPDCPGIPFIALTPADESWEDFTGRCSNQPGQQLQGPYLHVPFDHSAAAFSPFGPTEPASSDDADEEPIAVFSPSRFAVSVCLLKDHAPYQALFAQKHEYRAVACVAALVGVSVRAYYDDPAICANLEALYTYAWTDPAAPLLEMFRDCIMVTIHESEHPFARVPHIVVSGTLPNAPWDTDTAVLPPQDEECLRVPMWAYMQPQEEYDEDAWYRESEEEEEEELGVQYCDTTAVSESEEDEADEARTPSPPAWSTLAYSTNSTTRLDEEEESARSLPSVTETRVRKPWLEDDDDKAESPSSSSRAPGPPPAHSARFSFNAPLSEIGEAPYEGTYQPLSPSYVPLWSSQAFLAAAADDDEDDARTIRTTHTAFDSCDAHSVYTDALEEQPHSEEDTDNDNDTASEYAHRARAVPRPSLELFSDDEDDASYKAPAPRGKANIAAGRVDWFELPEDDLGELWAPTVPCSGGEGQDT